MDRRQFIQTTGAVSVASLPVFAGAAALAADDAAPDPTSPDPTPLDTVRTWHFFDLWRFDHFERLKLRQGEAKWEQEAVFSQGPIGALSAWPTVFRDRVSQRWRMLYSADWKPLQLMVAESPDGRDWQPLPQPAIVPAEGKLASNHLFTLTDGSGGGVYLDPIADDGFPFKVYVHQRGKTIEHRAAKDPQHPWHQIARSEGAKRYLVEDFTLVSRDGLHWEARRDLVWSQEGWHPEPPIFGFYNRHAGRHQMTVRPGWGDRRVCLQSTPDFHDWSGPELLLQPDPLDAELIELYGMPVFAYGDGYVGLPWIFHCQSSEPTRGFNRFVGGLDCQLAYSYDGIRFTRCFRTPLVPRNEPGQHGSGAIEPSCLVESGQDLRIYSAATKYPHGRGAEAKRSGVTDNASILLHTLRQDGLMFIETAGDWGNLTSKPLVLLSDEITVNLAAPNGEMICQLTDLSSNPVAGFTFDDCRTAKSIDSTRLTLRWHGNLQAVIGRIVRLEIRLRNSRLYAIRGHFHFIDAQDRWLIEDGQPIS